VIFRYDQKGKNAVRASSQPRGVRGEAPELHEHPKESSGDIIKNLRPEQSKREGGKHHPWEGRGVIEDIVPKPGEMSEITEGKVWERRFKWRGKETSTWDEI